MAAVSADEVRFGFADLDGEHQVQIGLLLALQQALIEQRDTAAAADILAQLTAYTNAHFMAEQLLMRLHSYPQYDQHVKEHDQLVEYMQTLQRGQEAGDAALSLQALESLKAGILGHTKGSDYQLGSFLRENGSVTAG